MSNKVERKTLNVAIKKHLWESLDKEAKSSENQLSKTQIVEKALEQYFNVVVDNSNICSNSNSATTTNTSTIEPESQTSDEIEELKRQLERLQEKVEQHDKVAIDVNGQGQKLNQLEANQETLRSQLGDKVTPQQLDERLAMATEPIWEELNQTEDNFQSLRSQLETQPATKPQKKTAKAKTKPQEELTLDQQKKLEEIADRTEHWQQVFLHTNQEKIAKELATALIDAGLKDEDYILPKNNISKWVNHSERPNKKAKHFLAGQLFDLLVPNWYKEAK